MIIIIFLIAFKPMSVFLIYSLRRKAKIKSLICVLEITIDDKIISFQFSYRMTPSDVIVQSTSTEEIVLINWRVEIFFIVSIESFVILLTPAQSEFRNLNGTILIFQS